MLTEVTMAPIISPRYEPNIKNLQPDLALRSMKKIDLLQDNGGWQSWLEQWQLQQPTSTFLTLESYQGVLDACLQGLGVAMGYFPIVQPLIAKGILITPFGDRFSHFGKLYVVYRRVDGRKKEIQTLIQWILSLVTDLTHP